MKYFFQKYNILSSFNEKIRHYQSCLIIIAAFVIYTSSSILTYLCFMDEFKNRKNDILEQYYKIISTHTLTQLKDIFHRLSVDQSGVDTLIEMDKSDITVCFKLQCIRSNLFEFAYIFDKYMPDFVQYKIDINKKLLHRNIKLKNYELERTNYIKGSNQLSISVSIDPQYLNQIYQKTLKHFIVTFVAFNLFLILFVLLLRSIKKYTNKSYKNYYDVRLKEQITNHKTQLASIEDKLMKKIWNLEYSRSKEEEFNYLFCEELNKLAMIIQEVGYEDLSTKNEILPYSIPLYRKIKKSENISTLDLIEIFTSRFSDTENHISLNIETSEQNIKFSSKAALYQIIYSLISYILFILNEQPNSTYKIKLTIKSIKEAVQLYFEYDGFPIPGEQEMLRITKPFLKKCSNPFLLTINQVFNILRDDGFDCNIKYTGCNVIEILQKRSASYKQKKDNVIFISSFTGGKK